MMMVTPNHTLRRLIQSWCTCTLHASDGVERIPTPRHPDPPTITRTPSHISKIISPDLLRYTCLQRIRCFLNQPTASKKLQHSSSSSLLGTFEYAASVLMEDNATRSEKDEALSILAQMDGSDQDLIKRAVDPDDTNLLQLLFVDSLSVNEQERENGIKVLRLVYSVADPTQMGSVKSELLNEIISIISRDDHHTCNSKQATKHALKLLIELNPWGRNRVKAVGSGAVHALVELLLHEWSDRRISELGLVVLDQLCGCADLVGHSAGLAVVSKKILRVSHLASDRAVRVLASISRYVGTTKVIAEMMEVGVVAKLCLVIQVDSSSKTKDRAKDMLRLHSRVWKNSPCIPSHLLSAYPN